MKTNNLIGTIILLATTVCGGCNQSDTQEDEFITVDVTASYPEKELVLQDFMDVEYIPLETTDEFVCQGLVQAVGKDIIIVKNIHDDGNIFIFDRKGKALKKINRKGQGGEEYIQIAYFGITLDEEKHEMFVNDMYAKKVVVYDLDGNFKRVLSHKEGLIYDQIYNFNEDNLICHDAINENNNQNLNTGQSFLIISKQDGRTVKEIQIPFKEKKSVITRFKDEESGITYAFTPPSIHPIVPYLENYVPVELSADTLYIFSSDYTIKPFIVRTPSIQTMEPEVFLWLSLLTNRYYFMETFKKKSEHPITDLLYDKQEKALFRYKVYNGDYTNNEEVFMKSGPVNKEIPSRLYLDPAKLVRDYEKGRLKGRLKEIASKLNPEDNPVIMLIKHKK